MESAILSAPVWRTRLWTGRVLSTLAVLFLLFDGIVHVMKFAPVVETFGQLGYPVSLAVGLGILELVCVVAYLVPPTSVLGAILLTGYLGGAVATHLRIGSPLFSHVLFPVYVGVLLWAGLYLCEDRLRALVPLRS
jgi:hypothetical protein